MKLSVISMRIALIAIYFMLAACGQKGPLYLPEKSTQPPITATETNQTNKTDNTQPIEAQKPTVKEDVK